MTDRSHEKSSDVSPPPPPAGEAMLVPYDFDATPGAATPPPGLVVVHHRRHTELLWLLLAMLLGSWAAFLYSQVDRARFEERPGRMERAVRPAIAATRPSEAASLVLEVKPLTAPTASEPKAVAEILDPAGSAGPGGPTVVAAVPPPAPPITAVAPAPRKDETDDEAPAIGFNRPGEVPAIVATPPAPDDTERALNDIGVAARAARREQEDIARARAHQGEVERQRALLAAQARDRQRGLEVQVEAGRRETFRGELRAVLQRFGGSSAPQVRELVRRNMIDPSPDVEQAIAQDLSRRGRGYELDRALRINLLRSYGLSEAAILSDLAVLELRGRASRSGARGEDQALVRAAWQLLAVRPPSASVLAAQAASRMVSRTRPAPAH